MQGIILKCRSFHYKKVQCVLRVGGCCQMNQVSFLAFGDDALSLKRKSSGGRAALTAAWRKLSLIDMLGPQKWHAHLGLRWPMCAASDAAAQLCLLLLAPLQ